MYIHNITDVIEMLFRKLCVYLNRRELVPYRNYTCLASSILVHPGLKNSEKFRYENPPCAKKGGSNFIWRLSDDLYL